MSAHSQEIIQSTSQHEEVELELNLMFNCQDICHFVVLELVISRGIQRVPESAKSLFFTVH